MKAVLLVCVLAALAVVQASVVRARPGTRANLNLGVAGVGDRLLHRQYLYQPAIPNTVQYQDLVYRGNSTTRISVIQAYEVGSTQYASVWLISGGIGRNNATLRVQSARGYGYYYQVGIWGR
ncbi:uncharacterized protein LOC126376734 [Pectinophora gossypiella]|nr:uncharacterized protein LOC126376734 [Pectinophora gossypiella]